MTEFAQESARVDIQRRGTPFQQMVTAALSAVAFFGPATGTADARTEQPFLVAASVPQYTSNLTAKFPSPLPIILRKIGGCESNGSATAPIDYEAYSKISTASGGFQFLDSTWSNFKGYKRAMYAPPHIQDWRAKIELKNNGTSPWNESKHCWAGRLAFK